MATRADQIFAAWEKFHADHPEVWKWFERFAFEALHSGAQKVLAYLIANRIRWHVGVERREGIIALNNNFVPYYARLWREKHPSRADLFECRELITQQRAARRPDRQEFVHPEDNRRHAGVREVGAHG